MSAKQLMPNQCAVLHPIYGVQDCCLCNRNDEIDLLKSDINWLLQYIEIPKKLSKETKAYMKSHIEKIRLHARQGLKIN